MLSVQILGAVAALLQTTTAQETVYAAYIFHRHGDRTPKSLPPANLTSLGYQQVYSAGQYFHDRYVQSSSSLHISGLSSSVVRQSDLSVSAPVDTVLTNSAQGFLQGFYPPVSQVETLANGSSVSGPLGGYQLIPVSVVSSGTGQEDNLWLQDASGCDNAKISSNKYFTSAEYNQLSGSTQDFYNRLAPVTNATFTSDYMTYKNAYGIFDLINVARIHNRTIPSGDLLDNTTVSELQVLANQHEYGLAYNSTDTARAVSGMQLAGEVVNYFNTSIVTKGKKGRIGIQFGAYATFLSFFGLTDLPARNVDFYGIPDYASSAVFEVFASGNSSGYPADSDLKVRFFYSNGSAALNGGLQQYPLFGAGNNELSYTDFMSKMRNIGIADSKKWCQVCGNNDSKCAAATSSSTNGSSSKSGGGMSAAVGGVIGAMVTLAVILGTLAAIMLLGGFRLAKKSKTGATSAASSAEKA